MPRTAKYLLWFAIIELLTNGLLFRENAPTLLEYTNAGVPPVGKRVTKGSTVLLICLWFAPTKKLRTRSIIVKYFKYCIIKTVASVLERTKMNTPKSKYKENPNFCDGLESNYSLKKVLIRFCMGYVCTKRSVYA
ncbi:uncharacterized protein LOC111030382 [Myzus persicae]|uniref:uncharacterized protein LOC111030382 n=1 Tax=Myzus persicae TaxID=13164 RepID=UPI000B930754|nr:uncharacterized protein LOC111030382 [Myzus persicae]